jgi:quinol monooxygenase YgiN
MPMLRRFSLALLALAAVAFITPIAAQNNSQQQYVVVYVEFLPTAAEKGGEKLNQLAALAQKSAGLVSFEVNQQIGRPNFYSLVEVWRDNASYQVFIAATGTQALLTLIQPLLEAPFDERPGNLVE